MNIFALSGLLCALFCLVIVIVTAIYGRAKIHRLLLLFNMAVSLWGIGCFWVGVAESQELAILGWQLAHVGGVFVSALFFHLVCEFCKTHRQALYIFAYSQAIIFSLFNIVLRQLVTRTRYVYGLYYNDANIMMVLAVAAYLIIVVAAFRELLLFLPKAMGKNKVQALYMILGFLFGFLGGTSTFLPEFRIDLMYPFGNFGILIYCLILSYAVLKYRLLDIDILITRTSIFIIVYSIVLGIPFALAFGWREQLKSLMGEMWWLAPLISSTVLATIGPSIYLFIQKKAEDKLLEEQRRYQAALRRASIGMGRVKDLKRLLKLTVNIVTRTVRLENAAIYLFHPPSGLYILKALKGREELRDRKHAFIPLNAPLIGHLKKHREPLVYDEVKQRGQDFQDQALQEIGRMMEGIDAALLVPSFIEEDLAGLLVLGKKRSGKLYSHDDLVVFSILANQAALAIENAQFYEDMKKTHEQLMKAEKMATIGTMADGLSHQINNRLHAMGFIAGDALDTIKLQPRENLPPETKKVYEEMETSLGKIQDNVKRGGEIVEGLLKYSRKADEGFAAVELTRLLDASLEMAQFKIKLNQIDITRDFNGRLPSVRGNFTQLQEVFFNIIDNSYDAMMQRKEEMKEPGYRGKLEIRAQAEGSQLEIFLKDNGMGVREKDLKRLFTPFFTTKLSSKKGTGLGLYVIRKIIEDNHGGKVDFVSEYQKGSQTRLLLPIAT